MSRSVVAPTTAVTDKIWTVAEMERMLPGYRYEILEGVLYMAAATPFWPHPDAVSNLHLILGSWVKTHRLGKVLPPQTGVYLNETNYVDPDLVYVPQSRVPRRSGVRVTSAALAVEVVSPSNLRAPREEREKLLRQVGVEEVWYVRFDTRSLEVCRLAGEAYVPVTTFHEGDTVKSEMFPGLEFPLEAVWEDSVEE